MPALTRWFIKTALVYFVAAIVLGVALAAPAAFAVTPAMALLLMAGFGWMLGAPALIPLLGRVAEAGAVVAFAVHAWSRVKPLGV